MDVSKILKDNQTYTEEQRTTLVKLTVYLEELCETHDWYNAVSIKVIYNLCLYFVAIYSLGSIMYDVIEIVTCASKQWYRWRYAFGEKKSLIPSTQYYRTVHILIHIFTPRTNVGNHLYRTTGQLAI